MFQMYAAIFSHIVMDEIGIHMDHGKTLQLLREIPDHATFRGKGVNTGLVRQTWGMSLFGPM